jgi:prophage antirepressor-like protein
MLPIKSEMQTFGYSGEDVRIVIRDGDPWFVAADVCEILDITNTHEAVGRLDNDEKLTATLSWSGQNRSMWIVSEPGLYSLIDTSRKPEAKKFRRWIFHEVLPSIRKTGGYQVNGTPHKYDEDRLHRLEQNSDAQDKTLKTLTEMVAKLLAQQSVKAVLPVEQPVKSVVDYCSMSGKELESAIRRLDFKEKFRTRMQFLIARTKVYSAALNHQKMIYGGIYKAAKDEGAYVPKASETQCGTTIIDDIINNHPDTVVILDRLSKKFVEQFV